MRDLNHSARNNFRVCQYWVRDERDSIGDMSAWILNNQPSGEFWAKELNTYNKQAQQLSNVFMFDSNSVTLETTDIVDDLNRGCIVYYLGHAWIVNNIQKEIYLNESQYSQEPKYKTYISITR